MRRSVLLVVAVGLSGCSSVGLAESELDDVLSAECAVIEWEGHRTVLDLGRFTGQPAEQRVIDRDGNVVAEVGDMVGGTLRTGDRASPCDELDAQVEHVASLCRAPC